MTIQILELFLGVFFMCFLLRVIAVANHVNLNMLAEIVIMREPNFL